LIKVKAIQIHTTFTRQNLAEFDEFVRLLEEIRPALWSVFQLVPTGRGKVDDLLTAEEMEDLFVRLARLSRTAACDIKTTEGQHYRRVVLQQARGAKPSGARAPLGINDGISARNGLSAPDGGDKTSIGLLRRLSAEATILQLRVEMHWAAVGACAQLGAFRQTRQGFEDDDQRLWRFESARVHSQRRFVRIHPDTSTSP
jgi:hypothetical protein